MKITVVDSGDWLHTISTEENLGDFLFASFSKRGLPGFAQSLKSPGNLPWLWKTPGILKKVQFFLELSWNFEKISLIITKSP